MSESTQAHTNICPLITTSLPDNHSSLNRNALHSNVPSSSPLNIPSRLQLASTWRVSVLGTHASRPLQLCCAVRSEPGISGSSKNGEREGEGRGPEETESSSPVATSTRANKTATKGVKKRVVDSSTADRRAQQWSSQGLWDNFDDSNGSSSNSSDSGNGSRDTSSRISNGKSGIKSGSSSNDRMTGRDAVSNSSAREIAVSRSLVSSSGSPAPTGSPAHSHHPQGPPHLQSPPHTPTGHSNNDDSSSSSSSSSSALPQPPHASLASRLPRAQFRPPPLPPPPQLPLPPRLQVRLNSPKHTFRRKHSYTHQHTYMLHTVHAAYVHAAYVHTVYVHAAYGTRCIPTLCIRTRCIRTRCIRTRCIRTRCIRTCCSPHQLCPSQRMSLSMHRGLAVSRHTKPRMKHRNRIQVIPLDTCTVGLARTIHL